MASDDKVLINLSHGSDHPENVLTSYLCGVEALRAGKQAVMFLTMDGVYAGRKGFAETVDVPDAPPVAGLHDEYVNRGGRFIVCPVCVKTRKLEDSIWTDNAEVAGFPSVYEYTAGGALVFNY
jgi:predicted peroxiredoxin